MTGAPHSPPSFALHAQEFYRLERDTVVCIASHLNQGTPTNAYQIVPPHFRMPPAPAIDSIHKFARAVTLLQQCGRIDTSQPGSLGTRSEELIAAKHAAGAASSALKQGHSNARQLLARLECSLDLLSLLPRIDQPLEDKGVTLVNASHVVRDFLFIGAGSRGSNSIMSSPHAPAPKAAAFFELNNIKFIINVARELCPPSPSFTHDLPFEHLSYPLKPDVTATPETLALIPPAPPSHLILVLPPPPSPCSYPPMGNSLMQVNVPMKDEDPWSKPLLLPPLILTSHPPSIRSSELESYLIVAGDARMCIFFYLLLIILAG